MAILFLTENEIKFVDLKWIKMLVICFTASQIDAKLKLKSVKKNLNILF